MLFPECPPLGGAEGSYAFIHPSQNLHRKKKTFINSSFFHQQMAKRKILGTKIKSKKKKENLRLILKQTTLNRIGNRRKKK